MENLRNKIVEMLNSGQVDGNLLSKIYFSKCNDKCVSEGEFQQFFPFYYNSHSKSIVESLCKDYNILKIYNKRGELIKYK